MLTTKDVREITFSKQVNGYRREEVDVFLDKVEADYENYERTVREMNAKIHELETQLNESKSSEGSIQSVLLQAQKLADNIVAEAKEKSAAIIEDAKISLESFKAREKELSGAFDKKAEERNKAAREALDKILETAKENRDRISEVTQKTIEKQTTLYNRLKLETAAFKAEIMDKYKKQLELITKIPESIPVSPEEIAAAVDLNVNDLSDKEEFLKGLEESSVAKAQPDESDDEYGFFDDVIGREKETTDDSTGFVINTVSDDDEEEQQQSE
ncbi:MAG: DivIVA domain-containing protein [Clostridia bacterium]|nr:DivIVA domain-containing protein [Clostridia bacterium]